MPDTGYGSVLFVRACNVAPLCREIEGRGPRARWGRVRAGSLQLRRYHRRLPEVELRLTASPAGRMIAAHYGIRDRGDWRYRTAQGVLSLPASFEEYLRGRPRQAVRTNVGHARRAGLTVISQAIDAWAPGVEDTRAGHLPSGPIDRFMVLDAAGQIVADSIVSVDEEVALLHGLVAWTPHARWLLHTGIVERLCGACELLVTNSDATYLLGPGTQHFQRLLGYRIARLRVSRIPGARPAVLAPQPAGLAWPPGPMPSGFAAVPERTAAPAWATRPEPLPTPA